MVCELCLSVFGLGLFVLVLRFDVVVLAVLLLFVFCCLVLLVLLFGWMFTVVMSCGRLRWLRWFVCLWLGCFVV